MFPSPNSKYLKVADYAIKQLDIIQAAINLVEAEAANKLVAEKAERLASIS
jgi:hypothetical protein